MAKKEKIAVIADVHGNITALEAVLADAKKQGATRYWVLGDLLLPGPSTHEIVTLLQALKPDVWLNGNWELVAFAVLDGRFRGDDPEAVYLARLAMYAEETMTKEDWDWLKNRPLVEERQVNGLKFMLAHNDRAQTSGFSLYPWQKQENFDAAVSPEADVYVYGHTHQQMMRETHDGQLIINCGAAGQPYSPRTALFADQRAAYALLTVDEKGRLSTDFRRIDYDIEQELALAKTTTMPYQDEYRYLRHTGNTVTHDRELLARVNADLHYNEAVRVLNPRGKKREK